MSDSTGTWWWWANVLPSITKTLSLCLCTQKLQPVPYVRWFNSLHIQFTQLCMHMRTNRTGIGTQTNRLLCSIIMFLHSIRWCSGFTLYSIEMLLLPGRVRIYGATQVLLLHWYGLFECVKFACLVSTNSILYFLSKYVPTLCVLYTLNVIELNVNLI